MEQKSKLTDSNRAKNSFKWFLTILMPEKMHFYKISNPTGHEREIWNPHRWRSAFAAHAQNGGGVGGRPWRSGHPAPGRSSAEWHPWARRTAQSRRPRTTRKCQCPVERWETSKIIKKMQWAWDFWNDYFHDMILICGFLSKFPFQLFPG